MAVSEQTPINSSAGNGVTTVFPYTFKVLAAADLEVSVDSVVVGAGNYSVSGVGNASGGNVTFVTAPAIGTTVIRRRNMAYVRSTDFQYQGDLPNDVLNADQDAPVLMIQQLAEQVDRAVQYPVGESGGDLPSASARAGKFLAFDADGDPIATPGSGSDGVLRSDLAASSGASLVGWIRSGAGAVARSLQTMLRLLHVLPQDFGAAADGATNDGAAVRAAVAALPSTGGVIRFPRATYKIDASSARGITLAKPVNLIGDGGIYTALNPALATSSDDTIYVNPTTSLDASLQTISGLHLGDPNNGLRTGRHGVLAETLVAGQNLAKFTIRDMLVGQGSGYGFYHLNSGVANVNGGMYCGLLENNQFKGGTRFEVSGDSMSVVHNIMSGTGWGAYVSLTAGASLFEAQANNITTSNGAFQIRAGSRFRLIGNNCEHFSTGTVANNDSSVFDINGADGTLFGGVIRENLISGFGSSDATTLLRMRNCVGTRVEDNTFLSGTAGVATAIDVGSNCTDVRIGPNIFNGIATKVLDNGNGTMGVVKTAPLSNGWVAFSGGAATLKFIKSADGMVHLYGSIKSGTTANGTVIATLPVGFRPSESIFANGLVVNAGTPQPCEVAISTSGTVSINYVLSSNQLNINLTFPALNLANATSTE